MSEFSESYHLKSENVSEAVELLRRAGLKGYVFPPASGWVSFVAEGVFTSQERIAPANEALLLHYISAEDHGWSFAIFDAADCICAYNCNWNDDLEVDDNAYVPAVLQRFVSSEETNFKEVDALLHPSSMDEAFAFDAARNVPKALGIEHYEWLP